MQSLSELNRRIAALEAKPRKQRNNAALLDLYDQRAELIAAGDSNRAAVRFVAMLADAGRGGCGRVVRERRAGFVDAYTAAALGFVLVLLWIGFELLQVLPCAQ